MMSPRFILERDGHLTVTVPETIETTAEVWPAQGPSEVIGIT
jgi:hypothetical protein